MKVVKIKSVSQFHEFISNAPKKYGLGIVRNGRFEIVSVCMAERFPAVGTLPEYWAEFVMTKSVLREIVEFIENRRKAA